MPEIFWNSQSWNGNHGGYGARALPTENGEGAYVIHLDR